MTDHSKTPCSHRFTHSLTLRKCSVTNSPISMFLSETGPWRCAGDATYCVCLNTNSLKSHSRGSASLRSSLLPLLIDEEEDILCTWVCLFCSSTTDKTRDGTNTEVSIVGARNGLVLLSVDYNVNWNIVVTFNTVFMLYKL